MPTIDCLANRISAEGGSPAAEIAPPPPLTTPTTNADTQPMEPTAQQPSYADILRLSKPGTKESTTKKNRKNSLSKRKRTITITRTNNDQPPADPLTIRDVLNSTLRDSQAPPDAVISAAAVNPKSNYVQL